MDHLEHFLRKAGIRRLYQLEQELGRIELYFLPEEGSRIPPPVDERTIRIKRVVNAGKDISGKKVSTPPFDGYRISLHCNYGTDNNTHHEGLIFDVYVSDKGELYVQLILALEDFDQRISAVKMEINGLSLGTHLQVRQPIDVEF
jgi:hypothetical protein